MRCLAYVLLLILALSFACCLGAVVLAKPVDGCLTAYDCPSRRGCTVACKYSHCKYTCR